MNNDLLIICVVYLLTLCIIFIANIASMEGVLAFSSQGFFVFFTFTLKESDKNESKRKLKNYVITY